ncbi:MAG: J domain-containing protein [Pseudomonadota bacterium]
MRDPYSVLGVDRGASHGDIKKAYRRLAKKLHPDQNTDDKQAAQKFSEINQAYEIVGDEKQRARFDRGEIGPDGKDRFSGFSGGPGGFAGGKPGGGFENFHFDLGGGPRSTRRTRTSGGAGFEDILSNLFGGGGFAADDGFARQQTQSQKSPDATATLSISFLEAAKGTERQVSLSSGKVLKVNIPAGSSQGDVLRLKGQASGMPGAQAGDVLLTLDVAPHPLFKPDGKNLRLTVPVTLDEAVLGAKIRVPTLEGAVELTIPPGSSSGKTLRLKGKGLPAKSGAGDLYAKLAVVLPPEPDQSLKDYAATLRATAPYSVRGPEFNS